MSEQTGIKFEARNSMERDVVGMRLTDVSLEDAMAAIATATHGRWERNGNTILLSRDTSALNADRATRQKKFADLLAKQFDAFPGMLEGGAPAQPSQGMTPQQQAEAMRRMMAGNPGAKMTIRLLQSVGLRNLSDLTPGERRVFANRPTAMQRNLSINIQQIVRTFLTESESTSNQGGGQQGRFQMMGMGGNLDALRQGNAARVFLIVHRPESGSALQIQANITNNSGDVLATGFLPMMLEGDMMGMVGRAIQQFSGQQPPEPPPVEESDKIEVDPVVSDALKLFGRDNAMAMLGEVVQTVMISSDGSGPGAGTFVSEILGGDESTPTEKKWRDILADPRQFEPLNLFAGPILRAFVGDKDYVAWIPDRALSGMANAFSNGVVTKSGLTGMWKDADSLFEVAKESGPWILRPQDAAQAADGAVDRKELAKVLAPGNQKGYLRLDELAQYAISSPMTSEASRLDTTIAGKIDPFVGQQLADIYGPNRMAYLMWNRLSGTQKPTNGNPKTLGANSVTGEAREYLDWETFNSMAAPNVQLQQQRGQQQREETRVVMAGQNGMNFSFGNQNMLQERTEALPRGLNSFSGVQLTANEQSSVKGMTANGGSARVASMDQFGRMKAINEMMATATQGRRAGNMTEYTQYIAGRTTRYTITYQLANNVTLSRTLTDYDFGSNRAVAFNALPSDLQEEYRKAYDEMKTQMANGNMRFNQGGRNQQNGPQP
ncbi:MAG: hypothetical protein KF812_01375 [Fimbriimonadaceae bacterium]|nr:hypothetical protein [Fimbriimonadaceae bacterium]